MNDIQDARHKKNEKVFEFIDQNQTELNTTVAVTEPIKDELEDKIADTLANDIIATKDNTGVTETKTVEKDELSKDAREALSFLTKHFTTTANRTMLRQIDFTMEDLENAKDTVLQENAERINEIATPIMAALILIGYTAAMKLSFDTNLEDFRKMKAKPKVAIGENTSYGVEVELNLDEADAIIDRMDIEMNLLQFSKPTLYRTYYIIRKIDDAPTSSSNTVTDTVDGSGIKKVGNITYDPAATITLKVTGSEAIGFFFKDAGVTVGTVITVAAGATVTNTHADFAPSGTELWSKSTTISTPSSYKVTFN